MNTQLEYRKRLMSGLEASRLIKDGQTVFQTSEPVSILKALRERYLEYNNCLLYTSPSPRDRG